MLKAINSQKIDIVGVVTAESGNINADYVDLTPFCDQHGIPCFKTDQINSNKSIEWIKDRDADTVFCLGWSRLIKSKLLTLTPMGVIGYHPALLPQNRGRHPLIWALVLGLKETGSTFFFMDKGADSGDIISQEIIEISDIDNANTLYQKIVDTAKQQIILVINSLVNGNFSRKEQDSSNANIWRKRGEKDGEIDWRMSAQSIYNLIRGLTKPYVGAHFCLNDKIYKVWSSRLVNEDAENIEPGKVISLTNNNITVKCGSGAIQLLEVKPLPNISIGDHL